jgi:N-acetylmuramoyl-L-alanine amidase
MPTRHKVVDGDCLSSIAYQHGFFPANVWDAPENRELRDGRPEPNVLQAGDVVVIPDRRARSEKCQTDRRHVFRRKGVPERLRFQFHVGEEPRAGEPYELVVDGEMVASQHSTDGEGRIEHWIRPDARKATVRFLETEEEYDFALGGLDPLESVKGVKGRLKSLGFFAGAIDGAATDELRIALETYQSARGLARTGEADAPTRAALQGEYGV